MSAPIKCSQGKPHFWLVAFIGFTLLIGLLGYTQYRAAEEQVRSDRAQELTAIGSLKAGQIAEWRKERISDAIRFAQGPTLTRAITKADSNDLSIMLRLNRKGSFYEDSLLVSPACDLLASASDKPAPIADATRRAVQAALETRAPTLSDFYRNPDGSAHIDVAAPVFNTNEQPGAAFVLRCAAADFLYPLIQSWPVPSSSAETLLVRKENDEVVFLNKLRHQGHTAMTLRIPVTRAEVPAVQAVLGKQGVVTGLDYRGIAVLADIRPIPSSDWFIVTKVDQAEIQERVRNRTLVILGFVGLGILLAACGTAFGFRNRQASLYRNLYRSEQEQRAATEKFRTILYSIGDAVITTDKEGQVLQMNPVAEALTGWTESDAYAKPLEEVFKVVSEDGLQPVANPVWRVLREGQIVGLANHTVLIGRDGKRYPITDSGAPVRDEKGNIIGVVLVFRDQTAEHEAQNARLSSERRLATLMNNLPGIVYRCRMDTYWTMEFISQGCKDLTGYDAQDILDNKTVSFFDLIHPDDRQFVWDAVSAAVKRGQPYTIEYRLVTADGTEKWVWERGCAVQDEKGAVEALEGVIHDITERKRAAEEQAKLEEQLHQSQKIEAIGRLAGGVAHDFNNMLSVIIGNAELLSDHLGADSADRTAVEAILNAGKHSGELVKQLLGFASRQNFMPRLLNLNDTIGGMCTMLKRLIGEAVTLDWHPGADLWPVMMDPNQVDQILVNLIVNARDAVAGVGKITVETNNVSQYKVSDGLSSGASHGDYVHIAVSDTGCGMDAALQTQIFEPFFTTKPSGAGTGLGLSMVYGIVKQNNGFIRVVSQPGKGACFHIYLPRHCPAAEAPAAVQPAQPAAAQPAPAPLGQGAPVLGTILLVEDELSVLALTQALLTKLGFTVIAANGPKEAIQHSRDYKGTIHLLLTDVVMPEMSGRDLWEQLVKERPDMKSLFMSGYTADIIAHQGMIAADLHFLQKPFSRSTLLQKIHEALAG